MNWKILLVLPAAAVLVGESVEPPRLKLPLAAYAKCANFPAAKAAYLRAYALAEDDAAESMVWREKTLHLLQGCGIQSHELENR